MSKSYLSDSTYNFLKAVVALVLPAFGTFYVAIAAIWNFGGAQQVSATVLAVSTFLGIILLVSSGRYRVDTTGNVVVTTDKEGVPQFRFQMDKDPGELAATAMHNDKLHFNVVKAPDEGYLNDLDKGNAPQT